jgi:hypothetical protein
VVGTKNGIKRYISFDDKKTTEDCLREYIKYILVNYDWINRDTYKQQMEADLTKKGSKWCVTIYADKIPYALICGRNGYNIKKIIESFRESRMIFILRKKTNFSSKSKMEEQFINV